MWREREQFNKCEKQKGSTENWNSFRIRRHCQSVSFAREETKNKTKKKTSLKFTTTKKRSKNLKNRCSLTHTDSSLWQNIHRINHSAWGFMIVSLDIVQCVYAISVQIFALKLLCTPRRLTE